MALFRNSLLHLKAILCLFFFLLPKPDVRVAFQAVHKSARICMKLRKLGEFRWNRIRLFSFIFGSFADCGERNLRRNKLIIHLFSKLVRLTWASRRQDAEYAVSCGHAVGSALRVYHSFDTSHDKIKQGQQKPSIILQGLFFRIIPFKLIHIWATFDVHIQRISTVFLDCFVILDFNPSSKLSKQPLHIEVVICLWLWSTCASDLAAFVWMSLIVSWSNSFLIPAT